MGLSVWPSTAIDWNPGYRIVPSRFPSIYLFDRVVNAEDFDALYALESMTNPRLRQDMRQLDQVPENERRYGNGTGPIMAAFTHLNPLGSRFSDGSYGVFYAARGKTTAIAETRHHSEKFLAATNEEPIRIQMRLYSVTIKGEVVDLRGARTQQPSILDPSNYGDAQLVGRAIRASGAAGLVFPSVRDGDGGDCLAAFRTHILNDCLHAAYLEYHWNGKKIDYVTEQIA